MAVQGMELTGAVITVSDRVVSGEREDRAGVVARELLSQAGVEVVSAVTVLEGHEGVAGELESAIHRGVRVIVTIGGTGVGPRNRTPEATEPLLETQLPAVMTQILIAGLSATNQAGLSRGLVGLTTRESGSSLIVNTPGSPGGVRDALGVVCPLLGPIFERLY